MQVLFISMNLLTTLFSFHHAEQAESQKLIEAIKRSHRSTRELYSTTYCKTSFESQTYKADGAVESTQQVQSQSWHSMTAIRVIASMGDESIDYVVKDSIQYAITKRISGNSQQYAASKASYKSRYLDRGDAWVRGLLVLNRPGYGHSIEFEKLLSLASKQQAKREKLNGIDCVIVELVFPEEADKSTWTMKIAFDSSVNDLVRMVSHYHKYPDGSVFHRSEKVENFTEISQGLFFPLSCVGEGFYQGKLATKTKVAFSDIQINKIYPASFFALKYPHNVIMSDTVNGTTYRVNSAGGQLGKELPVQQFIEKETALQSDPKGTSWGWAKTTAICAACATILITAIYFLAMMVFRSDNKPTKVI